ncbi:MAG: HNH endonuclease [Chloroflexi bacterium]|nr:MAG: HNH endonuclease [Chloroflexota bacterium]
MRKRYFCKNCGSETSYRRSYCKYCDPTKPKDYRNTTIAEIRARSRYQANAWIRKLARRVYNESGGLQYCSNCGYSKHFEVCHIQPIEAFPEETTMSIVNSLDNLIALCPNCHWELDHGALSL